MAYENSAEYIKHHLTNLVYGQHPDGSWGFAHGADQIKEMGFWSLNVDSMFFSIGLGCFFLWIFRRAAKKASTDAPTGLQNFIEMMIEFIDDSVRGSFSGKKSINCTPGVDHICLGIPDELYGFARSRPYSGTRQSSGCSLFKDRAEYRS